MATNTPFDFPFEAQFDANRAQEYIITSLVRGTVNTCELVRVQAVRPVSDRVGFVTVQPLLLDVATNNVVLAQTPIYNVPYLRIQGGVSAIILDPAVGDIGVAMYAQKDITAIKSTLSEGPPATDRTFNTADGLYVGGFLNGAPTQYVQFLPDAGGINIHSPSNIALTASGNISIHAGGTIAIQSGSSTTVTASAFVVNAPTTFTQSVNGTATGAGQFTFASPITVPDVIVPNGSVNGHVHGGIQPGAGNSGPMH